MDSYNSEVFFHIPGIFYHNNMIVKFIEEIHSNPDILKTNAKIGSTYDSPGGIWNGGRLITYKKTIDNINKIYFVRDFLQQHNIPMRFTFSNLLLTEEHLSDEYCNFLLELFNTGNNEVIYASDILGDYIRDKYGDRYKYISSTTKRLNTPEAQLKEIDKDFYLVVIDYDYNKNLDFLKTITNPEKCELFANPFCMPNCPNRLQHFMQISKGVLGEKCDKYYAGCHDEYKAFWQRKNESHITNFITSEEINNIYLQMGFKHFKLEGRTIPALELIEVLIYYLIKDEYALEIRHKLQSTLRII